MDHPQQQGSKKRSQNFDDLSNNMSENLKRKRLALDIGGGASTQGSPTPLPYT